MSRNWRLVFEGYPGAPSGYRAWLVELTPDVPGMAGVVVDVALLLGLGDSPDSGGVQSGFRVLVGRGDIDQAVGVREAKTLEMATHRLAEVDYILHTTETASAVERILGLHD